MSTDGAPSGNQAQAPEAEARLTPDQLASQAILALHRTARQATLYETENEAQIRQLNATAEALRTYGVQTGRNLSLFWAEQSVFIGQRLLHASRAVYQAALEVAQMLEPLGVSRIVLGHDVPVEELRRLQEVFRDLQRNQRPSAEQLGFTRIRLRKAPPLDRRFADDRDLSPEERVTRTYAKAVVIMRRFIEELQRGNTALPIRVRRISQQLTDLARSYRDQLQSVAALHHSQVDDASQAVNAAILAVCVALELGMEPQLASRLAMAALLYDVGKPRVAGIDPTGDVRIGTVMPRLGEEQWEELPSATAAALTALAGMNPSSMMQTTLVCEALHLNDEEHMGAPYGGLRSPTMHARIVAMARRFGSLMSEQQDDEPCSASEAVAKLQLETQDEAAENVFRLLLSALGMFPLGAIVELTNGQIGQVLGVPSDPTKYGKPVVRAVINAGGGRLGQPVTVDLSQPPSGEPLAIARLIALADEAQLRAALDHQKRPQAAERASQSVPAQPKPAAAKPKPAQPKPAPRRSASAPVALGPTDAPAVMPALDSVFPGEDEQLFESFIEAPAPTGGSEAEALAPAAAPSAPPASPSAAAVPRRQRRFDTVPEELRDAVITPSSPPPGGPAMPSSPTPESEPSAAVRLPPEASVEGSLAETPLEHLLIYALDQQLTGSLVFMLPDEQHHIIYLAKGAPSKARTASLVAPLGETLCEMGFLDEQTQKQTLAAVASTGQLYGEHLIAQGIIDRTILQDALRRQLADKVGHILALAPETAYAYYDQTNLLADYGGKEVTPCESLALVMTGVRAHADEPRVDQLLARLGNTPLVLHPHADVQRLGLRGHEHRVAEMLRAQRVSLDDLFQSGIADERVIRTTIYALVITRCLQIGAAPKPPAGVRRVAQTQPTPQPAQPRPATSATPPPTSSQQPPSSGHPPSSGPAPSPEPPAVAEQASAPPHRPAPPRKKPPAPPRKKPPTPPTPTSEPPPPESPIELDTSDGPPPATPMKLDTSDGLSAAKIEQRLEQVSKQTLFEVLEVAEDATAKQVHEAYITLAKVWHPDRVPNELAESRVAVSKIFARINEAFQTLSNDTKRREYVEKLGQGGDEKEQEMVAHLVNAAFEFQKAEVLFKMHKLEEAEQLLKRVVTADPEQPQYLALLAWVQAQRLGAPPPFSDGGNSMHHSKQIRMLDEVIERDPNYEMALFYRATLLRQSGYLDLAIRDFKNVVALNPRNIDANRELRLFEKRTKGKVPDKKKKKKKGWGGLFGR